MHNSHCYVQLSHVYKSMADPKRCSPSDQLQQYYKQKVKQLHSGDVSAQTAKNNVGKKVTFQDFDSEISTNKSQNFRQKIPKSIQRKMGQHGFNDIVSDQMMLNTAKYFIRLTRFKKEDQIQESLVAFTQLSPIHSTENYDQIKEYIVDSLALRDPALQKKKESLKALYEEMSFNFCQVCLQFQCVTHLAPNKDNSWSITRTRQPVFFTSLELSREEIISPGCPPAYLHLKRWALDCQTLQNTIEWQGNYVCPDKIACSTSQSAPENVKPSDQQDQLLNREICLLRNILPHASVCMLASLLPRSPDQGTELSKCQKVALYLNDEQRKKRARQLKLGTLIIEQGIENFQVKDYQEAVRSVFDDNQRDYEKWVGNHYTPCDHGTSCMPNSGNTIAAAKIFSQDCSLSQDSSKYGNGPSGCECRKKKKKSRDIIQPICESYCGCKEFCLDSFQGCTCKTGAECASDKCLCRKHNRDCDPNRCFNCCIQGQECKNLEITTREEKRLITAPSLLCKDIVGLFTLTDLKKGEFVIDYTGTVYDQECKLNLFLSDLNDGLGRSYGFSVDDQVDVDAHSAGNLMRFANHADATYSNCQTKICIARGSARAILVASRNICAGEEIHFDYNFQKVLVWLESYKMKFVESFKHAVSR